MLDAELSHDKCYQDGENNPECPLRTRRGMVLTQRPVEALQIFTDSELKDMNLGPHRHRTPSKKYRIISNPAILIESFIKIKWYYSSTPPIWLSNQLQYRKAFSDCGRSKPCDTWLQNELLQAVLNHLERSSPTPVGLLHMHPSGDMVHRLFAHKLDANPAYTMIPHDPNWFHAPPPHRSIWRDHPWFGFDG